MADASVDPVRESVGHPFQSAVRVFVPRHAHVELRWAVVESIHVALVFLASQLVRGDGSPLLRHLVADVEGRAVGFLDEDECSVHFAYQAAALCSPNGVLVVS